MTHEHRWQRTDTDLPLAVHTHWHTCRDCGTQTQTPDAICTCRRPRRTENE